MNWLLAQILMEKLHRTQKIKKIRVLLYDFSQNNLYCVLACFDKSNIDVAK